MKEETQIKLVVIFVVVILTIAMFVAYIVAINLEEKLPEMSEYAWAAFHSLVIIFLIFIPATIPFIICHSCIKDKKRKNPEELV